MIGSDDEASSSGQTGPDRIGSFTFLPFRRERFPFRESVLWSPTTPEPAWERVHQGCDLVIDRAVLDDLSTRFMGAGALESGAVGLLLGRLCECPWTRRPWAHVSGLALAPTAMAVEEAVPFLIGEPRPPGVLTLGWLRVRDGGPVGLTPAEADLHRRRFDGPWQFAFLLARGPDGPAIGVFGPDDREELDEGRQRPFYERVVDAEDDTGRSRRRAADAEHAWRNYTRSARGTARPVRRAGGVVAERTAPDLVRWAAIVVGIGAGLALTGELTRDRGASVSSAATPMAFASSRDGARAPADAAAEKEAALAEFEERFAEFGRTTEAYLRLGRYARPGATDCRRLESAHRAVGEAFEDLWRVARGNGDPGVRARLRDAAEVRRMVDRRFADAACPSGEGGG